jgi:hypothetical protein
MHWQEQIASFSFMYALLGTYHSFAVLSKTHVEMQTVINTTLMAQSRGPSLDLSCQLVNNNKGNNMKGVNVGIETFFVTIIIMTLGC